MLEENAFEHTQPLCYFVWKGSSLLAYPKTLALPMVCRPTDWIIDLDKGANHGGYLFNSLPNICYQEPFDGKSQGIHAHGLHLKQIAHLNHLHLNHLQKVPFGINQPMLEFLHQFNTQLTNSGIALLSNKSVNPKKDLIQKLSNQTNLKMAELYYNQTIYWPIVQDFRGRVYQIGHFNIQSDELTRSLISFHSDKAMVNRKKVSIRKRNLIFY